MAFLKISSGTIDSIAQLISMILIFIFVLALTYFTTRFVGSYQKNKMAGSNVNVLETFRISNNKYIQIIKIGKKYFAIAVCKDTITYLCELDGEDLIYNSTATESHSDSFKAILDKLKKDKPED